jgi:ribosomal protein S6
VLSKDEITYEVTKQKNGMYLTLKVENVKRLDAIARQLKMSEENFLDIVQSYGGVINPTTNHINFYDPQGEFDNAYDMKEFLLSMNVMFKIES